MTAGLYYSMNAKRCKMIGLVDTDILRSTAATLHFPNLEICKLGAYYKVEEQQFCRLLTLEENDLDAYEKIYYFGETSNEIASNYKKAKNVIYGGTAFTRGIYRPFENEIIDYTLPRTALYKSFLQEKYDEGMKSKRINNFLDSAYYRMYAGKNKLPIPPIQKRKPIYIYDKNIFYEDWQETFESIMSHNPSTICLIHPTECKTLSQFFQIRKFDGFSSSNDIVLNLPIPLTEVGIMLKKYKNKLLSEILKTSNIYLPLGREQGTDKQFYFDFIYTMNLLYLFWNYSIPIKIKFIEPRIGEKNPMYNLSKKIEIWSRRTFTGKESNAERTILDTFSIKEKEKDKSEEQKEYEHFMNIYRDEKAIFKVSFNSIVYGGRWKL